MKLWVDDARTEPEGWVRARTHAEAAALIERAWAEAGGGAALEWISLDHDLGDFSGPDGRELTGYDVAQILCAKAYAGLGAPAKLSVHSSNPCGAASILAAAERHLLPHGTAIVKAPAWRGIDTGDGRAQP